VTEQDGWQHENVRHIRRDPGLGDLRCRCASSNASAATCRAELAAARRPDA